MQNDDAQVGAGTPDGGRPDLGTVVREGDQLTITYVRELPADTARTWRALTESEDLRHWFPADIIGDREPGSRLTFRFWPEHLKAGEDQLEEAGMDGESDMPGDLLAWEPEQNFEFTWDTERLVFDLESLGSDSTRLTFSTWLAAEGPWPPEGTMAGWYACLHGLVTMLRTGTAETLSEDETTALAAEYGRIVAALGVPETPPEPPA